MPTYSFLSVQATLSGPGGNFSLGNGAGAAEEGITVEMLEEKDLMSVGADGKIMHSLRASNGARMTVRLLKTSPVNAQLSDLYNFQRQSPQNWGANTLVISDTARGDILNGSDVAFGRQAPITYAKDAGMNEWLFYGNIDMKLGVGTPAIGQ